MELRKVTAIIRSSSLQQVEERLQAMNVKGMSVSNVKGYGEYANFFTHDWQVTHSRIEIFTEKKSGGNRPRDHGDGSYRHVRRWLYRRSAGRKTVPHPNGGRGGSGRYLDVGTVRQRMEKEERKMWTEYGWLIWVLLGGGFLFLMFRRGGCGAGHGGHGGRGGHGGDGPGGHEGHSGNPPAGKEGQPPSHGGCH